jgi:ABC-type multidrug transport system fused ATPase/permease subunit
MLMAPIKRASNLAALLQRGVAAAESIFAVLAAARGLSPTHSYRRAPLFLK